MSEIILAITFFIMMFLTLLGGFSFFSIGNWIDDQIGLFGGLAYMSFIITIIVIGWGLWFQWISGYNGW